MKNLIEIVLVYIKYVFFHRFNKLTDRHIYFLEDANWVGTSKIRKRILNKIKHLNNHLNLK